MMVEYRKTGRKFAELHKKIDKYGKNDILNSDKRCFLFWDIIFTNQRLSAEITAYR